MLCDYPKCILILDCFHLTLKQKHVNQVSGVLIGSGNTQQTHVPSYWIIEHVCLIMCSEFVLLGEQDSVHN